MYFLNQNPVYISTIPKVLSTSKLNYHFQTTRDLSQSLMMRGASIMMNRRKRIPYLPKNIASFYTTIAYSLKKEMDSLMHVLKALRIYLDKNMEKDKHAWYL